MSKGSVRRPEDPKAIARNWPLDRCKCGHLRSEHITDGPCMWTQWTMGEAKACAARCRCFELEAPPPSRAA
jgi:hypothetical protein